MLRKKQPRSAWESFWHSHGNISVLVVGSVYVFILEEEVFEALWGATFAVLLTLVEHFFVFLCTYMARNQIKWSVLYFCLLIVTVQYAYWCQNSNDWLEVWTSCPALLLNDFHMQTRTETCCTLDTCLHRKIHAQLQMYTDTCKHTLSSPYKQANADKRADLHRSKKNANSCSSSSYKPINADTPSALCVCRYQPLYADICSPWCLQAQADTSHDQPKRMLICARSLVDAHTCRRAQSPQYITTCEDTNTLQPMQIHAQLSTRANSC
jgi:hypothetical protein